MHGPTCIFWANPTPFSLQLLYLAGFPRLASVDCHLWAAATRGDADDVVKAWLRTESGLLLDLGISSPQFDDAHRGFRPEQDGPLDLRFDQTAGQVRRRRSSVPYPWLLPSMDPVLST